MMELKQIDDVKSGKLAVFNSVYQQDWMIEWLNDWMIEWCEPESIGFDVDDDYDYGHGHGHDHDHDHDQAVK
jgi:hypothetical protein